VAANETAVPPRVSLFHAIGLGQFGQRAIVEKQLVAIPRGEISHSMQLLPLIKRTARQQSHPRRIEFLRVSGERAVKKKQRKPVSSIQFLQQGNLIFRKIWNRSGSMSL